MNAMYSHLRIHKRRRALSVVEVVISTLLVAVVMLGAMDMLGAVIRGRTKTSDAVRGQLLAQSLMTEALNTDYRDSLLTTFGLELFEANGTRSNFDDVDDYNGWTASPPESRSGIALPNTTGWRHSVAVAYVTLANPGTVTGSDSGVKRVTVTIERNSQVVARLVALRSESFTP